MKKGKAEDVIVSKGAVAWEVLVTLSGTLLEGRQCFVDTRQIDKGPDEAVVRNNETRGINKSIVLDGFEAHRVGSD